MSGRLTAEQETRGAELYADGATERDVAQQLGCSASTAHRLRERLDGGTPDPDGQQDDAAEEMTRQRDDLARRIAALEGRAEQARALLAAIERERREALAAGNDSASFAGKRRQALEQAEDAAESAAVLSGEVARIEQQLAEDADRRELARLRAELADAIAGRDAVYAASGDRQRAAVLAVQAAAAGWIAVYTDEQRAAADVAALAAAVTERTMRLGGPLPEVAPPASTRLTVSPAEGQLGGGLALEQAAYAAQQGPSRAPQVAELLGRANGWLPSVR
jgi:AraC-like DNA-binding protein